MNSSLEYLLTRHPEILVLRIQESECSDEGLQYILSLGKRLTHIQLSGSKITGDGIKLSEISSLTTTLPNLEDLDISECYRIRQACLITLLDTAGVLKRLTMTDPRLHEVARLRANFSNLSIINN